MTLFSSLPTMAEVQAARVGPIPKGPSRLETKVADDRDEKRDEKAWRKGCIKRDGKICQRCKRVVVQQLELAPERLEVHHIAGRADRASRWDVRNGIVLCSTCHDLITRHVVHILQRAALLFTLGNKTYINGSKKVTFSEKGAA